MDQPPLTPEAIIGLIEQHDHTVTVEGEGSTVVIMARNSKTGELAVGTNEKGDALAALALVARQIHLKVPGLDAYRDPSDTIQQKAIVPPVAAEPASPGQTVANPFGLAHGWHHHGSSRLACRSGVGWSTWPRETINASPQPTREEPSSL